MQKDSKHQKGKITGFFIAFSILKKAGIFRIPVFLYEGILELRLSQLSVFANKEKCDCIRSDVASGAEVIRSVDKVTYFDFFSYFIHNIERIFVGIGMCNTDDLLLRVYDIIAKQIDQCI